jgi:hypothetical protein
MLNLDRMLHEIDSIQRIEIDREYYTVPKTIGERIELERTFLVM